MICGLIVTMYMMNPSTAIAFIVPANPLDDLSVLRNVSMVIAKEY